jgi:hypothetical protein
MSSTGCAADVWGYGPSYVIGAGISLLAIPALALSRRENSPADFVEIPTDEELAAIKPA